MAVEFRNKEWLCAEVNSVLDRHGATLCLADYREVLIDTPNPAAPFIYLRRHGSHRGEGGNYTSGEIAEDAARIRSWLADSREVFVFYNNDWFGYALDNAFELARQLAP